MFKLNNVFLSTNIDTLVLFFAENKIKDVLSKQARLIDKELNGIISRLIADQEFTAKKEQIALIYSNHKQIKRVFLVGLGNLAKKKLNSDKLWVKIVKKLAKSVTQSKAKNISIDLDCEFKSKSWSLGQLIKAFSENSYNFDEFKSKKSDKKSLEKVFIYQANLNSKNKNELNKTIDYAHSLAAGVDFCKNLANLPANICTPGYLAKQSKKLILDKQNNKHNNLSCKILNESELKKLGMNAMLAVGQGSSEESKLIILKYNGDSTKHIDKGALALVGKGVTFDTGGISLKPSSDMDEMKYDMCGAAAVLGTFIAVSRLNLAINLIGVIGAVENMPGSNACKPGDIVTSYAKKTIEILNTDAEGRLVLADALSYVVDKYQPSKIVDLATLTGAALVALGKVHSAILGNDDELLDDVIACGNDSLDLTWKLPISDEYHELSKSNFADLPNISEGGDAGTITAACFLSHFVKDTPWAHLDIAGVAWNSGVNKGATGRPVPLLLNWLVKQ